MAIVINNVCIALQAVAEKGDLSTISIDLQYMRYEPDIPCSRSPLFNIRISSINGSKSMSSINPSVLRFSFFRIRVKSSNMTQSWPFRTHVPSLSFEYLCDLYLVRNMSIADMILFNAVFSANGLTALKYDSKVACLEVGMNGATPKLAVSFLLVSAL